MTEEKILWFLGLDKEQKMNKFLMKYAFWSSFITTIVVIGSGLLFKIIPLTLSNIIVFLCFLLVDVVSIIFLKMINIVIYLYYYVVVVFIVTIFKFLYGFLMFSRFELVEKGYPIFTWIHFFLIVCSVAASICLLLKFYIVYRDLKTYTVEYVETKLRKKEDKNKRYRILKVIIYGLSGVSPFVLSRLFKAAFPELGLGFGFWLFICCWIIMVSIALPKFIVIIKHKAVKYLKNKRFNR